jgi:hypothetical protein
VLRELKIHNSLPRPSKHLASRGYPRERRSTGTGRIVAIDIWYFVYQNL